MTLLRHYIEELNRPFRRKRHVVIGLLIWTLLSIFVITLAVKTVGPEPLPATSQEKI